MKNQKLETRNKQIFLGGLLSLFVFVAGVIVDQVGALDEVGVQVDQAVSGTEVVVGGKHAPGSEVIVTWGDPASGVARERIVAAGVDEGDGVFELTFQVSPGQDELYVFAVDPAGETYPVLVGLGLNNELLPPSLVVDPASDLDGDEVRLGGYSFPGAVVTVELVGEKGFVEEVEISTEDDGGWVYGWDSLEPDVYTVWATSDWFGDLSQESGVVEFEVVEEGDIPVAPKQVDQVVNQVSKAVETIAKVVLPVSVQEAAKEAAEDAQQVSTGVAPVVGAGLLTQLSLLGRDLFYILMQTGISAMQYLGFWRRRNPWGIVYDAVTKQPMMLATVRLYRVGKAKQLLETDVTSKAGVFSFSPEPGDYVVQVAKAGYNFPSDLVKAREDGEYAHVYHGEEIRIGSGDQVVEVSVPMDPKQVDVGWRFRVVSFLRARVYLLTIVMLAIGWIMSLVAMIGGKRGVNGLFFLFYSALLAIQFYLAYRRRASWGRVVDENGNPVPGVQLGLMDPKFNKLVSRRVSDPEGKYQFIVPEGTYVIKVGTVEHTLVTDKKKAYSGGEIIVKGKRPRLVALRVVVSVSS